jgi:hypothetical protein
MEGATTRTCLLMRTSPRSQQAHNSESHSDGNDDIFFCNEEDEIVTYIMIKLLKMRIDITPTPCTRTRWMAGQVFGNGGVVDIGTMENPSANSAWRSRVAVHTYAVVVLFCHVGRWKREVDEKVGVDQDDGRGDRRAHCTTRFVAFVAEESSRAPSSKASNP